MRVKYFTVALSDLREQNYSFHHKTCRKSAQVNKYDQLRASKAINRSKCAASFVGTYTARNLI